MPVDVRACFRLRNGIDEASPGKNDRTMAKLRFADLYCRQQGIAPADFDRHVFHRVIYPHAKPLTWLLWLVRHDYFRADWAFIADVGRLSCYEDFFNTAMDFSQDHCNGWYVRRVLRLRVSTERTRRLVRDVFKSTIDEAEPEGTLAPFPQ